MYKKIIGLFLFISFQSYCMMRVNQLPMQCIVSPQTKADKNYNYNKSFFQNKMIPDVQLVVMSNLDHRSNIQFISTCKHLYKRYVQQTENGGIYHSCLFTKHPFQFSPTVDFNVYFDCYNRALFHYAPRHEPQTKILLSIEDEIIQDARAEMLKKCGLNYLDLNLVTDFYKQKFERDFFHMLIRDSIFLQTMLKRGLSPNLQNKLGTLLHRAVSCGEIKVMKILLADKRTDPNIKAKHGDTVLHNASDRNQIEAIKILLSDHRIDVNAPNKDGETAFMRAVSWNRIEALKELLMDPRVDVNAPNKDGETAFMRVASWNRIEALKELLMDPRVDVNAPNKDGETAFMRVASWNRIEALKELLMDLRVDVNATNKDGYTVLMQAARFNKVEQVKMLLANNRVRRDIEYRPGRVAYHLAKNSEIIELLSKGMSWSDKHLVDVIEAAAPAAFMLVGIVIYDKIFPKQS